MGSFEKNFSAQCDFVTDGIGFWFSGCDGCGSFETQS